MADEKYPNLKHTNLAWDPYMKFLLKAINDSKYMKRAERKPMMTPREAGESHLTSRAAHLRAAADIAKRIADELELNSDLAYLGMLLHDAGHPFSAHDGEVIFTELNDIYNGQYFHHNAKGLEVIMKENILENALASIPNLTPELEKDLREEFDYFLDIVISHDGEASKNDLLKKAKEYPTIHEAVDEKLNLANAQNKYKFIAQTPEGQVAKYSDAIAYIASDIQDAFRMGFLTEFDDEYLEIIGTMFLKNRDNFQKSKNEYTREEKIKAARDEIDKLQEQKLREQFKDIDTENNRRLINEAKKIKKELLEQIQLPKRKERDTEIEKMIRSAREKNPSITDEEIKQMKEEYKIDNPTLTDEDVEQVLKKVLPQFREKRLQELSQRNNNEDGEEHNILVVESEETKIKEFTYKFVTMQSEVVQAVTGEIQEFFINDIRNASKSNKDNNMPCFSEEGLELMMQIKKKNMKEFVINTKWSYQQAEYPEAALKIVKMGIRNLVRAGTIRNKFYDQDIREQIEDPEAKKYMRVHYYDKKGKKSETGEKYKREIGLRSIDKVAQTKNNVEEEKAFTRNLIEYVEGEGQNFVNKYMQTFNAIETRIRTKVERALTGEGKTNEFYEDIIQKQLDYIREEYKRRYTEITPENKEEFISELVKKDRENMEIKMAEEMVSDYLAGMTDLSYRELAINLGFVSSEAIKNAERGAISSGIKETLATYKKEEEKEMLAEKTKNNNVRDER